MTKEVVQLFGRPELHLEGRHSYLESTRVDQFLAYLAVHGGWVRREQLVFLFWSEQVDSVGRRNLRKLLYRARQQVVGIEAEGDRIRWLVGTDLQAWREALNCQDITKALRLFRGPLLEGLDGGAGPEFSSWLETEREQTHRRLQRAIAECAALREETDPDGAAQLFRQLLEIEPLNEEAARSYLENLARAGRYDALEQAYRSFVATLEAEVGLAPEPSTRALYETLMAGIPDRGGDEAPAPAAPGGSAPGPALRGTSPPWGGSTVVGREKELAQLNERLSLALSGRGGVIAVEGEAGVGKTRLVEEFLARTEGLPVFVGRCYEQDLSAPLEPVRSALGASSRDDSPQSTDGMRFWTADPRDRITIHQGLTARLLDAVRQQGAAILFIDDLQWGDAATLEFLSYAAKRVHDEPVLIVTSHRREDRSALEGWLAHLSEHRAIRILGLGRLDSAQTRVMLQEISDVETTELVRFAEFVHRESEGNPFYALEYLRWLRDAGVLELDAAQRVAGLSWERLEGFDMPAGVRSLIWARYRGLEVSAREVLDVAAIIGRTFRFDLLERASGRDPLELWSILEPLIASGLIVALPDGCYAFSHDKLRQMVYEGVGPPVRRALHARVAAALAAGGADPAELSHHLLRAESWAEAYEQLRAAARHAEAEGAWEVALRACMRTLDIVDRLEDPDRKRFEVLQMVEKLLEYMDRRPEWFRTVDKLTALADRLGDARLVAEAALKRMAARSVLGDRAGAAEALARANAIFADLGDVAAEARAHRELAYLAWMRSDYQEVVGASLDALRIYRQLGNRRAEAATAENISRAFRWLGRPREAVHWGEEAARIYLELGDLLGDYLRLDTLAWSHMHRGEDDAAAELLERILSICERMDDKHLVVEKHMNLGKIHLNHARYRKALHHFEAAAQLGAETGDPRHESYPLLSAGATLERLGEVAQAARAYLRCAQLLEISFAMTGVADDEIGRADALTLYGSVVGREPDRASEALESLEAARRISDRRGDDFRLSKIHMEVGALHWRGGRLVEAADAYRAALELAGRLDEPDREVAALASLGVVYRDLGRFEDGIAASSEALERLRSRHDPLGEAYLLSSLAAAYRKAGRIAEARSCLERSLELRRELGDERGQAEVLTELSRLEGDAGA